MGPGALLTAKAPVSSDAKPAEAPPSCVRTPRNSPRHAERRLTCLNRRCTLPATCKHQLPPHVTVEHTLCRDVLPKYTTTDDLFTGDVVFHDETTVHPSGEYQLTQRQFSAATTRTK